MVPSPLPVGRLPAAGLRCPPQALPGRGRAGAGAVLPDPGGAADQPGEPQKDLDPVSSVIPAFFFFPLPLVPVRVQILDGTGLVWFGV